VREGDNLIIRQGSDKLIVDWNDFSIGEGELTKFIQPGSNSAALNRVYGGNPSSIYGSLRANGKVYLINPNGVFIGPSGRIDAGSFVASTLDTSDEEFLKGAGLTFKGGSDASVVNLGTITALDGDAFLIARTVENHGAINAPNGTAGLAAGTEVILQPAGDEKIGVSIASGSGKVVNAGTVAAAQAELKAAGGNLYALAIKNTGTIRATGVERQGGRVLLRATGGTIENAGTIRAKNANGTGGRIAIGRASKANERGGSKPGVRVVNSGVADASGSNGGTVSIAADEVSLTESSQLLATGSVGSGGLVNVDASRTIDNVSASVVNASGANGGSVLFAAGAKINTSGTLVAQGETGLGGDIRITANDILVGDTANLISDGFTGGGSLRAIARNTMEFHGIIFARAMAENANGGFAEVSGLNSLAFDGTADLSASFGNTGALLLDPTNFTINAATAAVITTNLATSNVVIATSNSGSAAGDIFVNSAILYSSTNNLSLLAHRHIEANASIQNGGGGAVSLVAGWDGVTGLNGDFDAITAAPSSFGNNGGSIFIGSGNQASAIAVGSRFGTTNAAGFAMALAGSNQSNTASAQFGYQASAGASGFNINGPIQVALKEDLTVTGGGSNFAYAQIGHGGPSTNGDFQGSISIYAGGDLRINGGVNFSYSQIGMAARVQAVLKRVQSSSRSTIWVLPVAHGRTPTPKLDTGMARGMRRALGPA
jgi:filamentous hemagglutinin family protein